MLAENGFNALFRIRESFKYKLQGLNNLDLFLLLGHLDHFNREVFEFTPFLVYMFRFENILSILINLKNKFKLEENDLFNPKSMSQNIYDEYLKEFHCLKQFEFMVHLLRDKEIKLHSYIFESSFLFQKRFTNQNSTS